MAKRRRKLQPEDFELRALKAYNKNYPELTTSFDQPFDGCEIAAVRSRGAVVQAYLVKGSRMRRITLPEDSW